MCVVIEQFGVLHEIGVCRVVYYCYSLCLAKFFDTYSRFRFTLTVVIERRIDKYEFDSSLLTTVDDFVEGFETCVAWFLLLGHVYQLWRHRWHWFGYKTVYAFLVGRYEMVKQYPPPDSVIAVKC